MGCTFEFVGHLKVQLSPGLPFPLRIHHCSGNDMLLFQVVHMLEMIGIPWNCDRAIHLLQLYAVQQLHPQCFEKSSLYPKVTVPGKYYRFAGATVVAVQIQHYEISSYHLQE